MDSINPPRIIIRTCLKCGKSGVSGVDEMCECHGPPMPSTPSTLPKTPNGPASLNATIHGLIQRIERTPTAASLKPILLEMANLLLTLDLRGQQPPGDFEGRGEEGKEQR